MKVVRLSALRTGRLYTPGNIPGTHFCYRLSRPQGHSAAGRIMSMKNSNDTIGNRTRDLPTRSAVPQPTEPPSGPSRKGNRLRNSNKAPVSRCLEVTGDRRWALSRMFQACTTQATSSSSSVDSKLSSAYFGTQEPSTAQPRMLAVLAQQTGRSRALVHPAPCQSAASDDTGPQFVASLCHGQLNGCFPSGINTSRPASSEQFYSGCYKSA